VAVELSEALLSKRPDLADYPEAVGAWARVDAMTLLYADYHARVGRSTRRPATSVAARECSPRRSWPRSCGKRSVSTR
jgi:hypothetical protein